MQSPFERPSDLRAELASVWAADTASPSTGWLPQRPATNHCSVTALIVQDLFGGQIVNTRTVGGTHYYNIIGGARWDLTADQFVDPISYDDTPCSRNAAMADTSKQKYQTLVARLKARLVENLHFFGSEKC